MDPGSSVFLLWLLYVVNELSHDMPWIKPDHFDARVWWGHHISTGRLIDVAAPGHEIPGHPWDIRKHSSKWVLHCKRNVKLKDLRTNMRTVQLGKGKNEGAIQSRWTAPGVLSICWWFLGEVSWWSNQLAALCSRGDPWNPTFGCRVLAIEIEGGWRRYIAGYIYVYPMEEGFVPNILVPMQRTCFMVKACIILLPDCHPPLIVVNIQIMRNPLLIMVVWPDPIYH